MPQTYPDYIPRRPLNASGWGANERVIPGSRREERLAHDRRAAGNPAEHVRRFFGRVPLGGPLQVSRVVCVMSFSLSLSLYLSPSSHTKKLHT